MTSLRIDLLVPAPENAPHLLTTAAERLVDLMNHPRRFVELHGAELLPERERRRMTPRRAERLQAIVLTLRALLRHMDLVSMRVGTPRGTPPARGEEDVRYVSAPGQRKLVEETGLTLTRLRRALRDLRRAGWLHAPTWMRDLEGRRRRGPGPKQPVIEYRDLKTGERKWCACHVVYVLTPKLFRRLRLDRKLERERSKAYERCAARRTRIYAGPLMRARDDRRARRAGSREGRPAGAPAPAPVGVGEAPSKQSIQPPPTSDQAENEARLVVNLKVRLRQRNPEWSAERCEAEARALLRVAHPRERS